MSFVPPFNPNGPFYWPESSAVSGPYGPLIIGAGLSVTTNGILVATGGGAAVNFITGGTGIHVSANTGNVTVTNTGVVDILAGSGISLSKSGGVITVTNTAPAVNVGGTVTLINTGTGLTGGPISTSGTISLSNTGVGAATYTNPTITVNAQGQITFATNGSGLSSVSGTAPIVVTGSTNAIISVNEGSLNTAGVLKISDSVSTTCSTSAASSTAVKNAYNLAAAALPCSLLTGQGDLISSVGSGTPLRVPAGAEGSYLKVCAACVGTGGLTWDPLTVASGTVTSITAGAGLTGGTITEAGTIALDSTCVIPPSVFSSKGGILSATAASTPAALGLGSNGQLLTVNTSCLTGLEWVNAPATIPCSAFNLKGDILVGTSAATYAALPVGSNGEVLTACSLCTTGVTWTAVGGSATAAPTVEGVVYGLTPGASPFSSALGYQAGAAFAGAVGSTALGTCALYASVGGFNTGIVTGASIQNAGPALNPGGSAGITGLSVASAPFGFGGPYTNVPLTTVSGAGANATVSFTFDFGNFSLTGIDNPGSGYQVGDSVKIPSAVFGGFSDIDLTVSSTVPIVYSATSVSTSGSGAGFCATLCRDVTSGLICGVTIPSGGGGAGYAINDTVTFAGANLGGSTPTNNAILSVSSITNASVGSCNTAVGYLAGCSITTGAGNTLVGRYTGSSNLCNAVSLSDGTGAIKFFANCSGAWSLGNSTSNTGSSGQVLTSRGANNTPDWTSLPSNALPSTPGLVYGCTIFSFSTSLTALGGNSAGECLTTGTGNTAIGTSAMYWLSGGNRNTAVGDSAVFAATLQDCNDNTGVGYGVLSRGGASQNTVVGSQALQQAGTTSVGGASNVAIGFCSGANVCEGNGNSLLGTCSGINITTGSNNVALGIGASAGLFTGSNNITIGQNSGSDALCSLVTQSNFLILGNNNTSCVISKVAVTVPSDTRWKKIHGSVPLALPFVNSLNPITYQYCDAETGEITDERYRYGFCAQEILACEENPQHPVIVGIDNEEMYSLNETQLLPVLVNAIKELSAKVDSLQAELNALKSS